MSVPPSGKTFKLPRPPGTSVAAPELEPAQVVEKNEADESSGQPLGSTESAQRIGRQLAAQLDDQGYHPVVLFGSASSGKSSLLASLLAYLQVDTSARIQIELGEQLLQDDQDYGTRTHNEAIAFFYRSVEEFLGGKAHMATQAKNPFFIPVVLKPHGDLPEVKFAFLESRGEWYDARMDTNEVFQRLKEEVSGVLLNFPRSISFLHIAPYTQVNAWDEAAASQQGQDLQLRKKADLALVGAFNAYKTVRPLKHEDTHIFLITKWDAYAAPGSASGSFTAPSLEEVTDVALERYSRGYAAFASLNLGENFPWQKKLMQYSSGLISGRDILAPTGEVKEQVYRYPRVLWSWLYENATRSNGHSRKLFPEQPLPAPTLGQKAKQALAWILKRIGV